MSKDRMKQLLEKMREDLLENIKSEGKDLSSIMNTQITGDAADIAAGVTDRAMIQHLNRHDLSMLTKIESALIRLREGHYGVCFKCGKTIDMGRLEAVPFAKFCIDCKRA